MKKKSTNRVILIIFLVQTFFSLTLFSDVYLFIGLTFNSLLIIYGIKKSNYKFISPLFIGPLFFYVIFNLPILFFSLIGRIDASGLISFTFIEDEFLFLKSIWLVNIALLGYLLGVYNIKSIKQKNKRNFIFVKKISKRELFFVLFWFIISGLIRYRFKLGAAGQEAEVAYVGILQHLFYTGNVILFSYYFLLSLDKKNKSKFFFVILLGVILITTQIFLGWRGTAYSLGILCTVLYIIFNNPNKLIISKGFIIIAIMALPVATILGNQFRSKSLTDTYVDYASGPKEFVEKVFFRQQGLTRLLVVIENNQNNFLTNNFFISELHEKNISATRYIDQYFFGVPIGVKNSFGGSGPGCTFLMGGALFTFFIFFIIGVVLKAVYNKLLFSSKMIYIIIYSNCIILFRAILAENFGLYFMKIFFVTVLFSYGYYYLLKIKIND